MQSYEKFYQSLKTIPWLGNLGKPHPRDGEVYRIHDWSLWLGPEDPAVALMNAYALFWEAQLKEQAGQEAVISETWGEIEVVVSDLARPNVPYEEDQDAWYGPNMAVWSAAWFAALVGCWMKTFGSLEPIEAFSTFQKSSRYQWRLDVIWSWYAVGHWPCSFYWTYDQGREAAEATGAPKYLVVY
jgi:hypothetical protein